MQEWIKDIKNIVITVAVMVAFWWVVKDGINEQDITALGIIVGAICLIWGVANFADIINAIKNKIGGNGPTQ